MSAALAEGLRPERVPEVLLECVLPTFGMRRGAVLITLPDGAVSTTTLGVDPLGETSNGAGPWADAVATTIAGGRRPVLLRALGPSDPLLVELLPEARNV